MSVNQNLAPPQLVEESKWRRGANVYEARKVRMEKTMSNDKNKNQSSLSHRRNKTIKRITVVWRGSLVKKKTITTITKTF